jgi:hypothetical protein
VLGSGGMGRLAGVTGCGRSNYISRHLGTRSHMP